ncbi:MAG: hypothetical protein ACLFVU_00720 [Phycisphaerae bacterium]
MRRLCIPFMFVLLLTAAAGADEASWEQLDRLEQQQREVEADLRQVEDELQILREAVPSADSEQLAAARNALDEAEQSLEKARAAAGLDELREKLRTAQAARDEKATELIVAAPTGKQAVQRYQQMDQRLAELESRIDNLDDKEVSELARLRREHRHWGRQLYDVRRAVWERREVLPLYRQADSAYKAYGSARKKSKEYQAVERTVRDARKALGQARGKIEPDGKRAETRLNRKTELERKRDELNKQIASVRKSLFDGERNITITVEMPPKKGKPRKPERVTLWIPPNCDNIRGVIVAHPMIKGMATSRTVRRAAAQAGLATMVMPNYSFKGEETVKRMDAIFEEMAAKSGHSELKGAAVIPAGLSASVLAARNVGYAAPERTIGIVHVAGGNMHHNIVNPDQSLSGVPFIAMNGEFEWCGPEGGIRPEYGRQTQWVMIREQLLRRRRHDPQHLMSLVVVPGRDHGAWDVDLAALFVRKAAEYRAPKEKRDGSKPAKCRTIKAEDGWLTDADLDHPEHNPAPYDKYTGDKTEAFWHFDGEMAKAVREYHKGRFLLPDPTKQHPVPESWPKDRGLNYLKK